MGIYDKLDRFLPFDRYLDPLFGGGGGQAQPPRMVPQRSMMGPGVGGEMPQARMQAGPARPEKKVPKVSKLRVLDRVLGGQTFSEALDMERARPMQEERARKLAELASQVITDPREWMVFQSDPEAWAKENATRYAAANVGGGDSRIFGENGPAYTAPKYGFEGDQAVSVGPDGLNILGTRNPSFQEQTARMNAEQPMAVSDGTELYDPRARQVVYRNQKNFSPPRVGGGRAASGPKLPTGFILDGN
jgi:hypothetical protein